MSAQVLHLTAENENRFEYMAQKSDANAENGSRRARLLRLTRLLIDTELTERQRSCIVEHLINGKKQKEIAKEMNINESTVSRHIAAGKKKLQRAAGYLV